MGAVGGRLLPHHSTKQEDERLDSSQLHRGTTLQDNSHLILWAIVRQSTWGKLY
jgi:hypothetical protein